MSFTVETRLLPRSWRICFCPSRWTNEALGSWTPTACLGQVMTERDKPDQNERKGKHGDGQDGQKDALPIVAIRPKSGDTKVWPRLLKLTLKDGTPVEDMMLR